MIGKPFALVTIDSVGVQANSFVGILRASAAEAFMGLYDNVVERRHRVQLDEEEDGFLASYRRQSSRLSHQ